MLHVISTDYKFQDIGVELALGCTALVMSKSVRAPFMLKVDFAQEVH